jgi:hypothetical protein
MYFKITNEEENHRGLQYKDGLVEDIIPFNDDVNASCCEGGIYFSDIKNILNFCNYGTWIREIELLEDTKFVMDPKGDKWRANKVFMHPRKKLFTVETFKWLIENGADIHASKNGFLQWASENGHLEVIKILVENGANIHTYSDYTLRLASENGHLEVVKFLVENGADIHIYNDVILRESVLKGKFEIVKFLVENGANIDACFSGSPLGSTLEMATRRGHLEIVEYIKSKKENS